MAEIGGAGDTLNRLEEMVEEDREKAAGRARVARDALDTGDLDLQELEQKALAEQALASFAAEEGIALAPSDVESLATPEETASASKSMGPVTAVKGSS